jgi:signal transduction histidine kinase
MEGVGRLVVPRLGDWCVLQMGHWPGQGPCGRVVCADPSRAFAAEQLQRLYPHEALTPLPVTAVLAGGRSALFPRLDERLLARRARDDQQLRLWRELGCTSALVVALREDHRQHGTLCLFSSSEERGFDAAHLAMAEEVAHRAALTVAHLLRYEEARRAVAMRDDVLAMVSHDLRNALSVVQLRSAHLARVISHGDRRTMLVDIEAIGRTTEQMSHLIRDLLDSASIDSGRLTLDLGKHDFRDILKQSVEAWRPLATRKKLHLHTSFCHQRLTSTSDRDRIMQLLGNIIGNAAKFTPEGGHITVRARAIGKEIEVTVTDTGPGIPEGQMAHIFDRYWQADRRIRGAGLGLFISRAIVEAHGGRIWARSPKGEGTTIGFRLPRR